MTDTYTSRNFPIGSSTFFYLQVYPMTDTILLWFTISLWFIASGAIFIAATLTFSRVFNIAIPILGWGIPAVARFQIGETEMRLGLLPINAFVTVLDLHNEDKFPHVNCDGRHLSDISLWKQIFFSLMGLFAPLILSVALVPWPELGGRYTSALHDYVGGAFDPLGRGQELLVEFIFVARVSIPHALGIIAAKSLPWLALPFLTSPTTAAFNRIALHMGWSGLPKDLNVLVALVWFFPAFLPFVGWCIAAINYSVHAT